FLGGKSLESSLIAPLGKGFGLGLVTQEKVVVEGMPADAVPALPAAIVGFELADPAAFEKSILDVANGLLTSHNDAAVKQHEDLEKQLGQTVKPGPTKLELVTAEVQGAKTWRLRFPQLEQVFGKSVSPCFAISGKAFLVASSERWLEGAIVAAKEKKGL